MVRDPEHPSEERPTRSSLDLGAVPCTLRTEPTPEGNFVDPRYVDAYAEPVIEEVGRHLKWMRRGELAFDQPSAFFSQLLEERLMRVPEAVRRPVIERLVSFGHSLEREQRAPEASRTFLTGLEAAIGQLPAPTPAPATPRGTWTFEVGRGAARRAFRRPGRWTVSRPRGFRSW